jgi:hypothetical protein
MNLRTLSILMFVLFVAGSDRSSAQITVVLAPQKFPLLPITLSRGARLRGDESCKYFFLTFYGDLKSGKAYIAFDHDDGHGKMKEESFSPDRLRIVFDDNAATPYVMYSENDEIWRIHISHSDYDPDKGRCLPGVAIEK